MKTLTVIARWIATALLLTLLSACGPDNNNPSTNRFTVTTSANTGGTISSASQTVDIGESVEFTLTLDNGYFASVSGCDGRLSYDKNTNTYTYTTGAIEADCEVTAVFAKPSTPALSFAPVKLLRFNWTDAEGATHYRLLENPDGHSGFTQVGGDIKPKVEKLHHQVPLYARVNAQYILESCVNKDCYPSATVSVSGALVNSIGYVKASNSDGKGGYILGDFFGYSLSLNTTGDTLAVGAYGEDSAATGTGIDIDQGNLASSLGYNAGAVYVFTREGDGAWNQQAYIKASNTGFGDHFGRAVSLDNSGDILAVGAHREDSRAKNVEGTDINGDQYSNLADGDQENNSLDNAGAVYIFTRDGDGIWSQQAYIKASNSDNQDDFGYSLSLSGNGDTLAVGAYGEKSNNTGIDHSANVNDNLNQENNAAKPFTGAVYVFARSSEGVWSQQAYFKASNNDDKLTYPANPGTPTGDFFGYALSLDDTGDTLAVGAAREDSEATGVDAFPFNAGDQNSKTDPDSGAVYVFTRSHDDTSRPTWSQQAYIKASNTGSEDWFGVSLSLSGSGDTLAVAASLEDSAAKGIEGDQYSNLDGTQSDDSAIDAGAVYVYTRIGCSDTPWCQQAYIKASNAQAGDRFGWSLSLNDTGDTLAVSAALEDSAATGIDGDQNDNSAENAGAVYLFTRSAGVWSQRAYIKASNTEGADSSCTPDDKFGFVLCGDAFGQSISLDGSGNTLAVGTYEEDSNATGINSDQLNNEASFAGAVYLY